MKTIQYFFFVSLATILMAADCSNKDNEFYNDVFVTSDNLVVVASSDVPGDQTIFVQANIPRLLTVPNMAHPLDIYKTTGGAAKLNFSYELEREIDGGFVYIDIENNQVQNIKGQSETGSFVLAKSVYNTVTESYEYLAGIKNLPAGNYRLSFGYNSNANNIVEMRSESVGNNLFLNLNSPNTTDLDGTGYFHFTVL
ncbi:hypothetical protein [Flavobacterium sp.]|uniref:hypothetical protein n=1 Tax=Flavobacterium sp. TaxID=239 RepID=UPI0026224CB8|nr:hypothetical protein [Flavobacterium sp.]